MKQLLLITFISAGLLYSFIPPSKQITTLKDMKKALKPDYSYVPGGNAVVDADTVALQGFFMLKTEVTNLDYRAYLDYLKKSGQADAYSAALPDTNVWSSYKLPWNGKSLGAKGFANHYFSHPAYLDYPVVNVTKEQAEKYCDFLTMIWREKTGNNSISFRLPNRAEFIRAANGNSVDRTYSWGDPYLTTMDGRVRCNYLRVDNSMISRDTVTGKFTVLEAPAFLFPEGTTYSSDVVAPAKSFWPSDFDLYNLNGNAAEMIGNENIVVGGDWYSPGSEIRNQAEKPYTGANPMTGFRPVMVFVEKQP